MKIIFVRHGHPNYEKDCLTELGHLHAEAVAERLKNEKIEQIYASSCGRAYETAEHIANKIGLPVAEKFDFMRELDWGPLDGMQTENRCDPWRVCLEMAQEGDSLLDDSWTRRKAFAQSKIVMEVERIGKDFDEFLSQLGYTREGRYYRIGKTKYDTVAMVSHGGSSSAVIAHLFNWTFPFVCATLRWDFTAVAEVEFVGKVGDLVSPRFGIVNDSLHIKGVEL